MRLPRPKTFRQAVTTLTPSVCERIVRQVQQEAGIAEFTLRGTVAEGTRLGLRPWVVAIWCATTGHDQISTADLARGVGISTSSARRMLAKVRKLLL